MYGEGSYGELAYGESAPIRPAITPDGVAGQLRDLLAYLATATEPVRPCDLWHFYHLILEKAAHDLAGRPATRRQVALDFLWAKHPEGPPFPLPLKRQAAEVSGLKLPAINKALRELPK
jgi:hypothetical protein